MRAVLPNLPNPPPVYGPDLYSCSACVEYKDDY